MRGTPGTAVLAGYDVAVVVCNHVLIIYCMLLLT